MRKTAKTNRPFLFKAVGASMCIVAVLLTGCASDSQDALKTACRTDQDCPNPAVQKCVTTWGICVGQTNALGPIDAGVD